MDNQHTFKVGDVVELKSGGSRMTITKVGDELHCVWFAPEHPTEVNRCFLPCAALRHVEPKA